MKSILLDYCWVCRSAQGINNHHVIPQAYGGVDGPQVTLCATHHTVIHTQALRAPDTWHAAMSANHTPEQIGKLVQLTGLIHKARHATANSERPMQMQHKFTKTRSRKIRELKFLLGCSSLTATLDSCIDIVYAQQLNQIPRVTKIC